MDPTAGAEYLIYFILIPSLVSMLESRIEAEKKANCSSENYELEASLSILCNSRWFERGWTLQELIAPRTIAFFSSNWYRIGPQGTIKDIIHSITKIPIAILNHQQHISTISVAARMSWAARRKTSRPEDVAYCLLGIFNVNMPLLYGEGDRAFRGLQEQILRSESDHSLFAWGFPGLKNETREMDLSMPAPGSNTPISGMFATSPSNFEFCGDIINARPTFPLSSDGAWTLDFPTFSMLMDGALRIDLLALCKDDLEMASARAMTGLHLLQVSRRSRRITFAILECTIAGRKGSDGIFRLGIPLTAGDWGAFGRFGEPVLVRTSQYEAHAETRRKALLINVPSVY
jgi:hypothetical protein